MNLVWLGGAVGVTGDVVWACLRRWWDGWVFDDESVGSAKDDGEMDEDCARAGAEERWRWRHVPVVLT